MNLFATHSNSPGRASLVLGALLLIATGCPADTGGIDLDKAILVNGASDEVLGTMFDAVDHGMVTIDDAKATSIVSPNPDQVVPRDPPLQFAWSLPSAKPRVPRHGTETGDFVWLRLSGGGLSRDIDVIAVGSPTNWTPTADEWAEISAATGPITLTATNAFVQAGIIKDGPYRAVAPIKFSIAP